MGRHKDFSRGGSKNGALGLGPVPASVRLESIPEPFIGDVPLAGTWMGGAVIVPTLIELTQQQSAD